MVTSMKNAARPLALKRYRDVDLAAGMRVKDGIEGFIEVMVCYKRLRRSKSFPLHSGLGERLAWQHQMLEQLRMEHARGPRETATLSEDVERYLAAQSEARAARARLWLRPWMAWYGYRRREDLTLQDVQVFFQAIRKANGKPFSPASLNHFRTYLIAVWRWHDGRRHTCPASDVPLFQTPPARTRELSPTYIQAILEEMDDTANRARVGLLYVCGVRPIELTSLTPESFMIDDDEPHPRVAILSAKGGKDRVIPLPPAGVAFARDFIRHRGWRPAENLQRDMKRAARRAGLPVAGVTPYALRHAYGMNLSRAGADIKDIADLLGHRSLQTSTRYVHPTPERAQAVSARMWERVGLA